MNKQVLRILEIYIYIHARTHAHTHTHTHTTPHNSFIGVTFLVSCTDLNLLNTYTNYIHSY